MYNPSVQGMAGTGTSGLQNAAFAANAATAGLPANFFMANPFLLNGPSFLETTTGNTRYNALQFEMRRRLSVGFAASGSYQFMFDRLTSTRNSLREDWYYLQERRRPAAHVQGERDRAAPVRTRPALRQRRRRRP